jgi:hypothetical protein
MNLSRTLLMPWMAVPRSTRWITVAVYALSLAGYGLLLGFLHSPHVWFAAGVALGVATVFCWAYFMPYTLLLALNARHLCMPAVRAEVVRSLLLYALLTVGGPWLLLWPGGHPLIVVALLLIGAGIGMLYALLPTYLVIILCMLPALHVAIRRWLPMPAMPKPGDADFMPLVLTGAALVLLLVVLRWWQLLRAVHVATRGYMAASVFNIRRRAGLGLSDPLTNADTLRARPAWSRLTPDLRQAGPQAPVLALQVAFGGMYLPQTWRSRLRRGIPSLLLVVVALLYLWAVTGNAGASERHVSGGLFGDSGFALAMCFFVVSLFSAEMASNVLDLRWRGTHAELPLLALMPGLGRSRDVKRTLLHAAMLAPARTQLMWLMAFGIVAALLHKNWPIDAAMLGMVVLSLGVLAVSVLGTLGGSPLCGWPRSLLLLLVLALITFTVLSLTAGPQWQLLQLTHLAIGWAALVLWLLWLGYRGWRGLQRRPHAFLPN